MISTRRISIVIYLLLLLILINLVFGKRKSKTLLFPPTAPTRHQLIVGVGIPLEDLDYEAMTTGYVLKAEYFLPTKASELRPLEQTPLNISGKKRAVDFREIFDNSTSHSDEEILEDLLYSYGDGNDNKHWNYHRWTLYKAVETLGTRMGLDGRACMLRTICEAAETPFHWQNGLIGDILHILLTPSSSMDPLSKHSDNEYYHAEKLGRAGAPCDLIFKECKKSLLSIISQVYDPLGNLIE